MQGDDRDGQRRGAPGGTTKEVFADPRTRAAARLTGCKNILLHPGGGSIPFIWRAGNSR